MLDLGQHKLPPDHPLRKASKAYGAAHASKSRRVPVFRDPLDPTLNRLRVIQSNQRPQMQRRRRQGERELRREIQLVGNGITPSMAKEPLIPHYVVAFLRQRDEELMRLQEERGEIVGIDQEPDDGPVVYTFKNNTRQRVGVRAGRGPGGVEFFSEAVDGDPT